MHTHIHTYRVSSNWASSNAQILNAVRGDAVATRLHACRTDYSVYAVTDEQCSANQVCMYVCMCIHDGMCVYECEHTAFMCV
jgi:hypothetical protein